MVPTERSVIQAHTQTVLACLQNTPGARLRQILLGLVRLLHDFVEEVGLRAATRALTMPPQALAMAIEAGELTEVNCEA